MDTIANYERKNVVSKFVESVELSSMERVKYLISTADVKILAAALEIIENKIKNLSNNGKLSQRILYALTIILKRDRPTEETQMLWKLKNLLMIISQFHPHVRTSLVKMGIVRILTDMMKREAETQTNVFAWIENRGFVPSVHIISVFLPAITNSDFHDINATSNYVVCVGPNKLQIIEDEVKSILEVTLPILYNICQMPNCPTAYHLLMLKVIYWADDINKLTSLVPVEEILGYAKMLMDKDPIDKDNTIIGFAIVNKLRHSHFRCLVNERFYVWLNVKFSNAFTWLEEDQHEWIKRMHADSITKWLSADSISRAKLSDEQLISQINYINSILDFIMPIIGDGNRSESNLSMCYQRLREFIKSILNIPDLSRHKGKLTVSSEGITKFNNLVTDIIKTVDAILVHFDFLVQYCDLHDIKNLPAPKTPIDIELELCKSAAFDRVLGSSKSPEELRSNPLVRSLRLLSILYEVNENWGVLFVSMSRERLIERSCFVSEVLKDLMINAKAEQTHVNLIRSYILYLATKYSFLLSMEDRQYCYFVSLYRRKLLITQTTTTPVNDNYVVARKNVLNSVVEKYESMIGNVKHYWKFSFDGENGIGYGPTKEFYSEFSRDCQRFDRGLWSGEPGETIDGITYVNSQPGLFPSPKPSTDPSASSCLIAIGLIIAKSLFDYHLLDINFSNAFYKCLLKTNLDAQQLSVIDIKDVMPSIFKFVESLVDALREKWFISNDKSMTTEEQNQAISNITCDGCSFEDLCVNFTLPGYPEIEMMEGGSETILSIQNLEKYLKLIVWWLLYKNPQQNIKLIRKGFRMVLNADVMKYLYPHEYEEILCGPMNEQWTIDYLKKHCILIGRLGHETPVIQYLFEVLSSLAASDQRNFLQFVTSNPRLPVGGLAFLYPKLCIRRKGASGSPDTCLPSASTCNNTLLITEYSSKNVLEEKLLLAIREGTGFFTYS